VSNNNGDIMHSSVAAATSPSEHAHRAQTYAWTPNEWTSEPGANCAALQPAGSGVVKTLPPAETSVFREGLPPLQDEVKTFNAVYLEITGGLKNNKWLAIIPGIVGLPATVIATGVLLWMMFGQGDFSEDIGIKLLILAMVPLLLMMAYSIFSIAVFSPADEPIRFCRRDRKIYRYQTRRWRWLGMDVYYPANMPIIKVHDWDHCRAEVVRKLIASGSSARRDCFLEMAVLDPATHTVTERFRVGDRDVYSDFTQRIFLWETIRRYMQEGPDTIPLPALQAHRETFDDCIEEFNPFSLPAKSSPGTQRVVSYFFAALLWVAIVPYLLMIVSSWVAFKISRAVQWGDLEHTAFKLAPDDPAFQRTLQPEEAAPQLWATELKRRQRAKWLWLASLLAQVAWLWWFFSAPSYYQ